MLKFIEENPLWSLLILVISIFLIYNSSRIIKENYEFSKNVYEGTVITKVGKEEIYKGNTYSDLYLEIDFKEFGTEVIYVHPITYEKFNIGDKYYYHKDFNFFITSNRNVNDIKYKYSNILSLNIIHALTILFFSVFLIFFLIFIFGYLNDKLGEIITNLQKRK